MESFMKNNMGWNTNILIASALLVCTAQAQDIVDINPFWAAYDSIQPKGTINDLYEDLVLPSFVTTDRKYPVTWKSGDTLFLGHDGHIRGRFVNENKVVELTATITDSLENRTQQKLFKVSIHGFEPYSNYLFVYFPANNDENIYYALSNDGYNFTAMNNGKRVVAADTVSIKTGLPDPHVLRAPDGWF